MKLKFEAVYPQPSDCGAGHAKVYAQNAERLCDNNLSSSQLLSYIFVKLYENKSFQDF